MSNAKNNTPVFIRPYVVPPTEPHTHTIILLHGRGDNGSNFANPTFRNKFPPPHPPSPVSRLPSWKWVFPTSRVRFSTVFRDELEEWFDIYSLEDPSEREYLQKEGLKESIAYVLGLIEEEVQIVGRGNVVLGGISQGCATSIHALLAGGQRLGGWIGVSGWIPFRAQIDKIAGSKAKDGVQTQLAAFYQGDLGLEDLPQAPSPALQTPVLLGHGTDDPLIDISLGKQIKSILEGLGMDVTWKEYDNCGHWFKDPEGMDDIVAFLEQVARSD